MEHHFGFPIEVIIIFIVAIVSSITLDLVIHNKPHHEITVADSAKWAIFWIALALCFYVYLLFRFDKEWADLYLAGYLLEKTLSIDNLVVFIAIFASFGIMPHLQHRILYWGILGALIFRAIFVVIGTSLFAASPWVGFVFAILIAYSAIHMLKSGDKDEEIEDYSNHGAVKFVGRFTPIYARLFGERFFVRHEELSEEQLESVSHKGHRYVTPAFLCLIIIELSDIAFAFDSVPAVIAVTQEPLLVYAAMIFAILGLRTLYFIIAVLNQKLVHLKKAVIFLLFFIAAKMILVAVNEVFGDTGLHISPSLSLIIILGILAIGIIASFVFPKKEELES